jgi:PKD repeat protein
MMNVRVSRTLLAIAVLSIGTACTVHKADTPTLSGPSDFALSLSVVASPDAISQDGGSQSSIRVTARGPDGKGVVGLSLRMDMRVNGVAQDFGALSARNIVTGSDGTASVVYTAPPAAPGGITGTCASLPGTCVTIVATPLGTDFSAAVTRSVEIRLVPIGVILPPADTPTAQFTVSPASPSAHSPAAFDASASCGGRADTNGCLPSNNVIVSYSWSFGDGTTGSGKTTTHSYPAPGPYNVTLTVTNDRGLAASTNQQITVGAGTPPSAGFVFGPTPANVGQEVFFDASQSVAAPGHTIVLYKWNFGDGTLKDRTTATTQHDWTSPGTFAVRLTVVDEAGQEATVTQTITIGAGSPTATFTVSKIGLTVTADASASSASPGSTIASYAWLWGDGQSSSGTVATHTYPAPVPPATSGTFTITLTVTDNLGRTGRATQNVTIP